MAEMRSDEKGKIGILGVPTIPVSVLWMPHAKKKLSKCKRLVLRFWIS